MLATIVLDAYRYSEREEVAVALNQLIEENCWSTAGVYCYWNYDTKEVLYLGLTVDLYRRFLQHNFLIKANSKSCKSKEIKEYFQIHERIGFSIILQSRYSQPITGKLKKRHWGYWEKLDPACMAYLGLDGLGNIQLMEGITIETSRIYSGALPSWNRMNGSRNGQAMTRPDHINLLFLLTGQTINDNVAKVTLRELNTNMYGFYEGFLHGLRMLFMPLKDGLEFNRRLGNDWMVEQLSQSNYLSKKLQLPI